MNEKELSEIRILLESCEGPTSDNFNLNDLELEERSHEIISKLLNEVKKLKQQKNTLISYLESLGK